MQKVAEIGLQGFKTPLGWSYNIFGNTKVRFLTTHHISGIIIIPMHLRSKKGLMQPFSEHHL
jgi:hypothetical protein